MNQTYEQLIELLNAVWKRRWVALTVAWAVCVLGWTFVISKPDTYTSSTRIFLDTASVLKPLLQGLAIERDTKTELEVMKQTLTTRANLEKVARLVDLDITATTPTQMERLLDGLKRRTTIKTEGPFLLVINYRDTDPVRARDVVVAIGTTFIESNLGQSRAEIEDAQVFLDRQIAQYERALRASEERLAKFKKEKLSKLPDQQNYQFRIEQLRGELEEAEAALRFTRVQRNQIRQQLDRGRVSLSATEIVEAEQQLKALRTKYTKQHPDVVALQRKIAVLRDSGETTKEDEERARLALDGKGGNSPEEYANASLKLSEIEAAVASGADRIRRVRNRINRITASAAMVPEVEVQFARLNRDYDVLKGKHSELLSRREQAKISREREVGTERVRYEVVDPPRIPAIPDGPARTILMSAVFAVALAAGAGFAILLSFINSSFADPAQLRQMFGMTVLGTVSKVQSISQQTWQVAKLSAFAGSTLALFGAYGLMILMETRIGFKNIMPVKFIEGVYHQVLSVVGVM